MWERGQCIRGLRSGPMRAGEGGALWGTTLAVSRGVLASVAQTCYFE